MRIFRRSSLRTMAVVGAAGVGVLPAVVVWRRVDVLDRLVTSQQRPYVHQTVLIRRLFNPIAVMLGSDTVLVVRGRRSGQRRSVPMDPPFEYEGKRYLVSPLGDTHWARNLRAAGEGELRTRRHHEFFRAVELDGAERDAIVTAYGASITCGCRHYMAMLPDPAHHPAFRIETLESGARLRGPGRNRRRRAEPTEGHFTTNASGTRRSPAASSAQQRGAPTCACVSHGRSFSGGRR